MKTFLLILLVYGLQSDVKQYRLIEKYDGKKMQLITGYIAITKDTLYIKDDEGFASLVVDTAFIDKGLDLTFLRRDTLIHDQLIVVYYGLCAIDQTTKNIYFEIRNPSCGCRMKRNYKYK